MQIVNETDEEITIGPGEVLIAHNLYSFNDKPYRTGVDGQYKKYEDTSEVTTPIERHIEQYENEDN